VVVVRTRQAAQSRERERERKRESSTGERKGLEGLGRRTHTIDDGTRHDDRANHKHPHPKISRFIRSTSARLWQFAFSRVRATLKAIERPCKVKPTLFVLVSHIIATPSQWLRTILTHSTLHVYNCCISLRSYAIPSTCIAFDPATFFLLTVAFP
jgi:hypothetical protein